MNSAVNQAFERMKVNAIEKILSDDKTLAEQAAKTIQVISHLAKLEKEFKKQFGEKYSPSRAQKKINHLRFELNCVWFAEHKTDGMESMLRSDLVKLLARTHGYNIRTAWRRVNDMLSANLLYENCSFVDRYPESEQENPLR